MSRNTNAFKMDTRLAALKEMTKFFGLGDNLNKQVEKAVDNFVQAGKDWANETASDWYDSAPWATGNLRESIDVEEKDVTKPKVFVNHQKLMEHAEQKLPARRLWYKKQGWDPIEMPDYDYLEEAESKNAASASSTVYPIEPNWDREYNANPPHTPFIDAIWMKQALRNKQRIFK